MRALAAAALISFAAAAHAPIPTRSLRLQLRAQKLEGLLTYHLPAAAARVYAAAHDPSLALVPHSLAGLRIDADGEELHPKVSEARARSLPDGGLDELVLLEVGRASRSLKIAVGAEPPLPVELLAETGVRLQIASGPGAPIKGGLSLRPRPGVPCAVEIISAAAKNTPR